MTSAPKPTAKKSVGHSHSHASHTQQPLVANTDLGCALYKLCCSSHREQHYGVSDPINTSHPSADDLLCTNQLRHCLQELKLYEEEADGRLREQTLGQLDQLVQLWVQHDSHSITGTDTADDSSQPDSSTPSTVRAKIYTFGSYRLGVHGPGTDIDTLCVGPKHITRQHFFTGLYSFLQRDPSVSALVAVPDAYVPIIMFKMNGIDFDLMYAHLATLTTIPDHFNIFDDNNLRGIDDRSVLSLNGCRVTDMILSLVPNIPNFRTALRAIKQWAKSPSIQQTQNRCGVVGTVVHRFSDSAAYLTPLVSSVCCVQSAASTRTCSATWAACRGPSSLLESVSCIPTPLPPLFSTHSSACSVCGAGRPPSASTSRSMPAWASTSGTLTSTTRTATTSCPSSHPPIPS